LRVTTLKIDPLNFVHLFSQSLTPITWCSSGFTFNERDGESHITLPGKHPYHTAGLYYLQEPSAMAAAEILAPQPGEKVLDLAAAPGGKSTHMACLMNNSGLLVANEIHPKRVWDLAENIERCGVTNTVVINESSQRLAEHFCNFFDRVMLDAPCSGEGMFRKSEIARKEWKSELPQSCAIRQTAILEQAAQMVKPGGCIAYTTCTFSPEENEGVIARFLDRHPEFDIKLVNRVPGLHPARPEWINLPTDHKINRAIHIWPHLTQGEGHFIALLIKDASIGRDTQDFGDREKASSGKGYKSQNILKPLTLLDNFAQENLTFSFDEKRIVLEGSYVYQIPEGSPNILGLKVIHSGWWLGSIHKDRFLPSHALAKGIHVDQARHKVSLHTGDRQVSAYMRGECFPNYGENEWVLITIDGFPLGWGKRVNHVIKNYYPHGLRH
jgi:NOL1/NOP2/sun family putative RNA methylase